MTFYLCFELILQPVILWKTETVVVMTEIFKIKVFNMQFSSINLDSMASKCNETFTPKLNQMKCLICYGCFPNPYSIHYLLYIHILCHNILFQQLVHTKIYICYHFIRTGDHTVCVTLAVVSQKNFIFFHFLRALNSVHRHTH